MKSFFHCRGNFKCGIICGLKKIKEPRGLLSSKEAIGDKAEKCLNEGSGRAGLPILIDLVSFLGKFMRQRLAVLTRLFIMILRPREQHRFNYATRKQLNQQKTRLFGTRTKGNYVKPKTRNILPCY